MARGGDRASDASRIVGDGFWHDDRSPTLSRGSQRHLGQGRGVSFDRTCRLDRLRERGLLSGRLRHDRGATGWWRPRDSSRRSNTRPRPLNMDASISYGADIGNALNHYRPDRQFEAIEDIQQQTLDNCLSLRGYHQFRLTDDATTAIASAGQGNRASAAPIFTASRPTPRCCASKRSESISPVTGLPGGVRHASPSTPTSRYAILVSGDRGAPGPRKHADSAMFVQARLCHWTNPNFSIRGGDLASDTYRNGGFSFAVATAADAQSRQNLHCHLGQGRVSFEEYRADRSPARELGLLPGHL